MILVIEGARKTGKTTFINYIEKFGNGLKIPVFRFYDRDLQKYHVDQEEANFVSCMQFIKAAIEVEEKLKRISNEPIIFFDRFHISEKVFGMQYRGYDASEKMALVENELVKANAKLLFFISKTANKRTNEELFEEQFEKAFNSSKMNKNIISLDSHIKNGKVKIDHEEIEALFERL